MCGIAGWLDPSGARSPEEMRAAVDLMASAMVARGPDGSGTWADERGRLAFGHRRLSVLDLSPAGAQPMTSADGRYTITYNGEIYDHDELARDLRSRGVALRGHSDTEVLLEAIARWGVGPTLERIDGMFAFGLWDRREGRLWLARDRMGEKPLYYGRLGSGAVVFASTLDALCAHPDFDRSLDRQALTLYFRYKYVPSPWSIYDGISKLEPASMVTIDADGRIGEPERYWELTQHIGAAARFVGSYDEAVEQLDSLLRRSIRRRLVADVPVGAFLSGGIDSSLVVAIAQEEASDPLRTFTIGSRSAELDESSDARTVAEHLGTAHTELIVTDAEARSGVLELPGIIDEPFGDSSLLPTYLVSELARRDVTVALSGDGGDELFLGYNRYTWAPAIWHRSQRVPLRVRRALAAMDGRVPPTWWDAMARLAPPAKRPRQLGLKVSKALGVLDASDEHEVFHRLVSHWRRPTEIVREGSEPGSSHTERSTWPPTQDFVEHMAIMDACTYLPDDILTKVDRATMAVSLEGRIPLLDRSIVEFAVALPIEHRLAGGTTKRPMRSLLARHLPPSLFERPKSGFGVPIDTWLRGSLAGWARDLLDTPAVTEHLDTTVLDEVWRVHQSGRADRSYELWDVLMFAAWCERRGVRS